MPAVATLPRIGGGRSADVFLLPGGRVLKLFLPQADPLIARREVVATRLANRAGVATAWPAQTVAAEGRVGLIMRRVEGPTALAALRGSPLRLFGVVRALALYQARVHAARARAGVLPEMHAVLDARIGWSTAGPAAIAAARAALAALPRGERLCHGDLHPDNLMLGADGPVAIDWSQATRGDPAADVARTELLLRYAAYGRRLRRWPPLRLFRHLSAWWYRRCYRRITGMPSAAIEAWRLPVAVAWLQEGGAGFAPSLHRLIEGALRRARPHSRSA